MTAAPLPVTVHCALGVRCPPYSKGNLNCRSAEQKCEDVTAIHLSAKLPARAMLEMNRLSAIVDHAPYNPKKGIAISLKPYAELIH